MTVFIGRREFMTLLGGAAAWPLAARAQLNAKLHRIGILETTSPSSNAINVAALRQGLRDRGYIEGENLLLEYRSADGRADRFPELAAELIRLNVDLIVARGTPAVMAARDASRNTPIVATALAEPYSVVASLARPGGNVTGLSSFAADLNSKRVELLREVIPNIRRIGAIINLGSPNLRRSYAEIETATRAFGIQSQLLSVRKAEDIAPAFDEAVSKRMNALLVSIDVLTQGNRNFIVELAAKHGLPAMYASREFIDVGGLIALGVSYPDLYRRAATYIDKIFRGTRPADLPVEQPTKFELLINLKTAKALGLEIPPTLLARADEVIE
jgi:putative ABC transport system substrate-binding protein